MNLLVQKLSPIRNALLDRSLSSTTTFSQLIYIPILATLLMPVFNLSSTDDVSEVRSVIKWKTQSKANHFVSLKNGSLTISQDGRYFLYLQVTLETPRPHEVSGQHIVRVNKTNRLLLEVRMTNTSLSTGFLGRAVDLAASDILTVTVSPDHCFYRSRLELVCFSSKYLFLSYE
uniref:THD domain-containing protein n=1 Tax=Hucho hucho TaxID=62062 RepID=A0A4W5QSP3_9TELE